MSLTAVRQSGLDPADLKSRPDWLSGRPWTLSDAAASSLVFAVVVLIFWVLRTSIVPTDPWNYVQAARNFPADTWVPLGYTRYGMILPLLPIVALFGNSEVTYYFWPLVGAGLLAACLYLVGVRFWGRLTGMLAVVLAFSSPIVFLNSSRGYPDVQSTGVFMLAVVLAFHARDRRKVTGTAPAVLLLAVGFLLGWAFEARETTALTWPIIALILWQGRGLLRVVGLVAGAMAVWAVADLAIGHFGYGDALVRIHAFTRQDLAAGQLPGDQAAKAELVGRERVFYLLAVPRYLATTVTLGGWTLIVGSIALVGWCFRRTRFATLFFVAAFLGFVGITGGFFPDHPSGVIYLQRYWIPFLALAGLAAAGVVHEVARSLTTQLERYPLNGVRIRHRGAVLALALVVSIGPVLGLAGHLRGDSVLAANGATQLSQLRAYLATSTDRPIRIWSDWESVRLLPIYQRPSFGGPELWSAEFLSLNPKRKPKPGDYVVINSPDDNSCYFCRLVLDRYKEQIGGTLPTDWQEVWATPKRNLILYRVP